MKRTHLNLALLVAVGGLGAAAYFGQKKEEPVVPLTALAADALTRIAVEHPGQPKLLLEKQGGEWKLLEPVKADTDPFEVSALTSLATLTAKRKLPLAEVKLPELGLQPPAYRITLNDVALDFGGIEQIEARRYILSGGAVALVDDPPSAALDADYSDLVAKALVPEKAEIAKIELPTGVSVVRGADGKSWVAAPLQADISIDAAQKLANAWKDARAMWMAAEPLAGSQGQAVKVTLQDGRVLRFVIAERDPQLVIANPELKVRYTLSKVLDSELFELHKAATAPPAGVPKLPRPSDLPS
ncbi:DUF4340 domain-containing protein [Solimonas sp. K1W22B-7]|uniref:DUF4340 domain-containing protein n=1 Tax=Solimonas sp. K1W22B-7 TaxID=2303331 RepID=UPI000E335287|nr:DUF4340 domain-containing protein [Solimonas sp. K1W22B-7]AXQ27265.1 DUF4340 domain-containing protein [Solimonas sp. K1W22B-7]